MEVPAAARMPIAGIGEPVYIATPDGERTRLVRVDGGTASAVRIKANAREAQAHRGPRDARGGWVSTGDFLLQNVGDGAVQDKYTVNAGTPRPR